MCPGILDLIMGVGQFSAHRVAGKDYVHYGSVSYWLHIVKSYVCNLLFFWGNSDAGVIGNPASGVLP